MCQEARDEVEAALPYGADPAPLLLSMCARRLLPTPWLNKVLTPECRSAIRTRKVLGAALTQPKGANSGFSPRPGLVRCLRFDSLDALAHVTHSRESGVAKWRYNGCEQRTMAPVTARVSPRAPTWTSTCLHFHAFMTRITQQSVKSNNR